jgi:hypothetical protein
MDINLTSEGNEQLIELMIDLVKRCDGETLEYILKQSGQDEQMKSQLGIEMLNRRLEFILDDAKTIQKYLYSLDVDFEAENINGSSLDTHFANIEAACNLDDGQVEYWEYPINRRFSELSDKQLLIRNNALLIAKYEGYEVEENSTYGEIIYSEDNIRTAIDTLYHESWDWLMPAIEKIESNDEIDIEVLQNGTIIRSELFEYVNNVADISFDKKIDHTYDAVVKYLKLISK